MIVIFIKKKNKASFKAYYVQFLHLLLLRSDREIHFIQVHNKTARLTLYARPHNTGLPINTALAPSATAFRTSVPHRTPPSK